MTVSIARGLLICAILTFLTPVRESSEDADIERRLEILEKLLIFETNSIQDKMRSLEEKVDTILTQTKGDVKAFDMQTKDVSHQDVKQAIDTINRRVQSVVKGAQREKVLNQRRSRDIELFKNEVNGKLESILDGQTRLDNSIDNIMFFVRNISFRKIIDQVRLISDSIDVLESLPRDRDISIRNITDQVGKIRHSIDKMESSVRNTTKENNMIMKTVKTDLESVLTRQQNQGVSVENIRSKIEVIEKSTDPIESCSEYKERGCTRNGVYRLDGTCPAMEVYCDMEQDGGGWTVFQRRVDGSENFYRTWDNYKRGFGRLDGEFWLGNDNLNMFTSGNPQELRIDMEDLDGNVYFAKYSRFSIRSETENYKLYVSGFSGNISKDSMSSHTGQQFSTRDRDNDKSDSRTPCAVSYRGAWWYRSCYNSNLNGMYNETNSDKGIRWWYREDGIKVVRTFRKIEMKFRNNV